MSGGVYGGGGMLTGCGAFPDIIDGTSLENAAAEAPINDINVLAMFMLFAGNA